MNRRNIVKSAFLIPVVGLAILLSACAPLSTQYAGGTNNTGQTVQIRISVTKCLENQITEANAVVYGNGGPGDQFDFGWKTVCYAGTVQTGVLGWAVPGTRIAVSQHTHGDMSGQWSLTLTDANGNVLQQLN